MKLHRAPVALRHPADAGSWTDEGRLFYGFWMHRRIVIPATLNVAELVMAQLRRERGRIWGWR